MFPSARPTSPSLLFNVFNPCEDLPTSPVGQARGLVRAWAESRVDSPKRARVAPIIITTTSRIPTYAPILAFLSPPSGLPASANATGDANADGYDQVASAISAMLSAAAAPGIGWLRPISSLEITTPNELPSPVVLNPVTCLALPNEILHIILGHVAAEQPQPARTLAACARINRQWHAVSVPLLYHTPYLRDVEDLRAFTDTICSTNLGTFVHTLSLAHLPHVDRILDGVDTCFAKLTRPGVLPGLRRMDISMVRGITNYTLLKACKGLRGLEALNMAGSGRSDWVVIQAARECGPTLRELSIAWNDLVSDTAFCKVAEWCAQLRWLDVSGCWKLSSSTLVRGVSKLTALQALDVSFCMALQSQDVPRIVKACHQLHTLNIMGCEEVDARLLPGVLDGGKGTSVLNLAGRPIPLTLNHPQFCAAWSN
jgi:hypothetical protein